MRIDWLSEALENFQTETEFIAKDDPQAARLVVRRIRQAVSLLAENPRIGRPGRVPGTYEPVVPNTRYIVPYRIRPRAGANRDPASLQYVAKAAGTGLVTDMAALTSSDTLGKPAAGRDRETKP